MLAKSCTASAILVLAIQCGALAQAPGTQIPVSPQSGQAGGGSEAIDESLCPPDGSVVAYIDREGTEQRHYGRFLEVFLAAIRSRGSDPNALPEYIALISDFARTLQAKGLNVYPGDIIIHRQSTLTRLLSYSRTQPNERSDWELQLAVMNQLKRQVCHR
jgi:hypothetical protein